METEKQILKLEKKIKHQKHKLTQFGGIIKEARFLLKSKKEEAYSDVSEIINNLNDDLTMDKTGESGYKTEKEVVKAIKRYTLKVVDRKCKKWEKLVNGK